MRNKRDIYCEYAFWEEFFGMEKRVIHNRFKRKLWDAFYDFLFDNNLFFDIPDQNVIEDTCGGKNLMWLRQKKGGAGIKFIPDNFPKIEKLSDDEDNHLNSVFLTTSDTSKCEELSARFGVIVFNLSMIFSAKHVYVNNGRSFNRSKDYNWTYLWELKEKCPSISCCNSLVIADRYLLSDKNESAFDNNLSPILEALLPQSLENGIIFSVCFIVWEENNSSIEEKLHKIEILIKELRPKLSFNLNIFNSRILHDRSILTNNIILTSGAGFEVIGKNEKPMKFTTTSLYFPFLISDYNVRIKYLEWINNVLKAKCSCRSFQHDYWGEEHPRHHLLDFYYEKPKTPKPSYPFRADDVNVFLHSRGTII